LVRLTLKFPNGNGQSVSIPKFTAWKRNTQAFQYMCVYDFSGPGLNIRMIGDVKQPLLILWARSVWCC